MNVMVNSLHRDIEELEQKVQKMDEADYGKELEKFKQVNNQQLSKISELENDLEEKGNLISQLEHDNDDLTKRCKSLIACEAELLQK